MKIEIDLGKLTRIQLAFVSLIVGILFGSTAGWYFGRESVRNELRDSISPSLPGLVDEHSKNKSGNKKNKNSSSITSGSVSKDASAISIEKNEMDGTIEYSMIVLTAEKLPDSYGSDYGAVSVRCEGNATDVIIKAVRYLSSEGQRVKLRWDDGPIESEYMNGSTSGTAVFSRSPKSFIAKAAKAQKLVLQYTPWRERDEIAVYKFTDKNRKDFNKMQEYCK